MKLYRFGFDPWGLGLFVLIMLPNVLWMLLAGENDLLMQLSATPRLDALVSVCQVLTVAGMVFLCRRDTPPVKPLWLLVWLFAYLLMWVLYGVGLAHPVVLMGLAVFPCAAIVIFLLQRRNFLTLIPAVLFAAGHIVSSLIRFVL